MFEGLLQPTHLIIILVIVLIVFGPGKLPDLGSALGKGIREFKRGVSDTAKAVNISEEVKPETAANAAAMACPKCGVISQPGQRFCSGCGAALVSSASEATHSQS